MPQADLGEVAHALRASRHTAARVVLEPLKLSGARDHLALEIRIVDTSVIGIEQCAGLANPVPSQGGTSGL
jgi:hypothetical protein